MLFFRATRQEVPKGGKNIFGMHSLAGEIGHPTTSRVLWAASGRELLDEEVHADRGLGHGADGKRGADDLALHIRKVSTMKSFSLFRSTCEMGGLTSFLPRKIIIWVGCVG